MIIISPLRVQISKRKQWTLNINGYRNAHHMVLNNAKQAYKREISQQLVDIGFYYKISVHYTLFKSTRRRCDLDNVCSIHRKFFQDALVELGHISDDDVEFIVSSSESFGGYDKNNGRVEIEITEVAT